MKRNKRKQYRNIFRSTFVSGKGSLTVLILVKLAKLIIKYKS